MRYLLLIALTFTGLAVVAALEAPEVAANHVLCDDGQYEYWCNDTLVRDELELCHRIVSSDPPRLNYLRELDPDPNNPFDECFQFFESYPTDEPLCQGPLTCTDVYLDACECRTTATGDACEPGAPNCSNEAWPSYNCWGTGESQQDLKSCLNHQSGGFFVEYLNAQGNLVTEEVTGAGCVCNCPGDYTYGSCFNETPPPTCTVGGLGAMLPFRF